MNIIGLERLEIGRLPTVSGKTRTNPALPSSPVIYFIHADGIVYYVEATKSLYMRWRSAHHSLIHLPQRIKHRLQLSWLDVSRSALSEIEAGLIKQFRPKLNRNLQRYPLRGRWDKD